MMEIYIIGFLGVVLAVVTAGYVGLAAKLKVEREHEDRIKEKAREKAGVILRQAQDKAMQMIREAKVLTEEQSETLAKQLKKTISVKMKDYEEGVEEEVKGFRKTLELEAVGAEKVVAARVEREYEEARVQVEEYKKAKLAKIDAEIMGIVSDTVKNVTGKVIPLEEHRKLIISALEEAKREHVL